MRNFTFLLATIAIFLNSNAQVVSDTVTMGAGYANDVYYSLENGYLSEYSGDEWTVAFYNDAYSAAIMINGGRGVELWNASDDTSTFATIDTTGNISSWDKQYDDETMWDSGSAFEQNPSGTYNYGWGAYNSISHLIEADRVFVLKSLAGTYYKVMVLNKTYGVFEYRYATLDNTLDTTITVDVPDLVGKNYAYLDMDNHTILDREPLNTEWDLLFTKYYDTQIPYPVTGVQSNKFVGVVKVENTLNSEATYTTQTLDTVKNAIGSDWKSFNMSTFAYDVDDSVSYFIKDVDGDLYHLYFTRFDGSSTGVVGFNVEKIVSETTAINNSEVITIETIYPNPSKGASQLVFSSDKATEAELSIFNLLGERVYYTTIQTNNGLNTLPINLENKDNGVYLIQLTEGNKTSTQKLILNK